MFATPTTYTSKNGKKTPIKDMVVEHLNNAIFDHERTRRDPIMLGALKAEKVRRGL